MITRKRPGFSLIELVTIALVIGVQLAILFPILEKSREEGRKSTCKDNLRECSTALHMYINDYDNTLPSSVSHSVVPGKLTQADVTEFLTGGGPLFVEPGPGAWSWAQVIQNYMIDTNCVTCPSDIRRGRLSYWYKYAVDLAWRGTTTGSVRKPGDFGSESCTVVLYEHAGWHTGDAAGMKDGVTINVLYLSGSAATVKIKNGPTDYPSVSDEAGGASALRLGEPMYFNFDSTTNTAHTGVADWMDARRYYDKY